jgi:hypothetical protein
MMNTVRHTFHIIGDRGGDFAKTFGSNTADLAKRVGDGTVGFARDIGPRRALLGLALAAVAIGGSVMLIRYLRSRRVEDSSDIERGDDLTGGIGVRSSETSRSSADFRNSF